MSALFYEDVEVGQVFRSPGRTVTEADVTLFAMLSGDWNPLHTDAEFARETAFGERIAHGAYGIAVATGLLNRLGTFDGTAIALLGIDGWRFTAPIRIGDTVHAELEIAGKRLTRAGDRGIVQRRIRLCTQDGTIVQEGRMDIMVRRRAGAGTGDRGAG